MLCLVAEKMVADTKVNLEILSPTFWVFFFSNYFKSCKLRQLLTSDLKILIIFFLFIFVGFIGNRAEGLVEEHVQCSMIFVLSPSDLLMLGLVKFFSFRELHAF